MSLLLAVPVVLALLPVLWNGFVLWDDDLNFLTNDAYRGLGWPQLRWMFTTFHLEPYQPLSWVTLGADYVVWGLDPMGYHLTSLLLHAADTVLLFHLIKELLYRGLPPAVSRSASAVGFGAAFGALFFGLHPLRVEPVAWASSRHDALSGVFYLLTLLAYLRVPDEAGRTRGRWLAASLAAYALSLLCKAWGMTLPVVLLVLDVYPLRRLGTGRRTAGVLLLEKIPYAALATVAAVLAVHGAAVEAMRPLGQHGPLARLAQAAYGTCFYLVKTLLPLRLSPLYLLELPLDPARPRYLLSLGAVVGISAALFLLRRRWPWALAAWVCYGVIAAPVLGLAQSGPQIAADRYTYLASMPWCVLLAAGAARTWVSTPTRRPILITAASGVLLVLALLSAQQTLVWRDSRTLWERVLSLDPTNYVAYLNRGVVRQAAGDLAGALTDYDAALSFNPGDEIAYNNRGIVHVARGELEQALADYAMAIRFRPTYADAYLNRAIVRETQGDVEGGVADYTTALRLNPGLARAYYGRGNLRAEKDDIDGALADYGEAIRVDPHYPEAYGNRAALRAQTGDRAGAIADYRRALQVAPSGWTGREQVARALAEAAARNP